MLGRRPARQPSGLPAVRPTGRDPRPLAYPLHPTCGRSPLRNAAPDPPCLLGWTTPVASSSKPSPTAELRPLRGQAGGGRPSDRGGGHLPRRSRHRRGGCPLPAERRAEVAGSPHDPPRERPLARRDGRPLGDRRVGVHGHRLDRPLRHLAARSQAEARRRRGVRGGAAGGGDPDRRGGEEGARRRAAHPRRHPGAGAEGLGRGPLRGRVRRAPGPDHGDLPAAGRSHRVRPPARPVRGPDQGALRLLVRALPAVGLERSGPARHLRRRHRPSPLRAGHGLRRALLPPIHPIGKAHRKGKDNSLTAGPGEPGSPYAVGSEEGGHKAIHPELGTSRTSGGW
jgi:hypothetical protein